MCTTKKYKVFINGQNFLLDIDGNLKKMGFYTTFFLEATDPQSAEYAAVDLLRADSKLRPLVKNSQDDRPLMFAEKIVELQSFEGCQLPRTGFVFYREDAASDNQEGC